MRRVGDHRARASAGNGRGLSAPGASAEPRPLARGRCRARQPTPTAVPASRRPVVARRYAGLRHRDSPISAGDPSNGADDSFAVEGRRLGRSSGRVPPGWRKRHPRLRPPTANPLAPIRLDGADS